MDREKNKFQYKLNIINKYMKQNSIDFNLQSLIRSYLEFSMKEKETKDD